MPVFIGEKLRQLTPYDPIAQNEHIHLDANESFLPLPAPIRDQLVQITRDLACNRYPDPYAVELCRAFAGLYGVKPELVTAGNGSDELIGVIVSAFCEPGATVAVFEKDFSMYRFYPSLYGNCVRTITKHADLTIDVLQTIEAVRESRARILFFSNPCNPTSVGLMREKVLRIADNCPDCLVVADEAYMDFWDQSVLGDIEQRDNLLVLKTCSKAIGMAGLRVGFAVTNQTLTRYLQMAKSPYNLNAYSQAAAAVLLREKAFLREAALQILQNTQEFYHALSDLFAETGVQAELFSPTANFIYMRTEYARQWFEALKDCGIIVRGFEDALRITTGTREENQIFLTTICRIIGQEREECTNA